MDWNEVEGNWKILKGKVKEKWGQITDSELTEIAGKKDQLLGKIQEKYGILKDEAEKQLNEWRSAQSTSGNGNDASRNDAKTRKSH